jgi:mono/diheme cytochrome c family protein
MTYSRASTKDLWTIPLVAVATAASVTIALLACGSPEPGTASIDRSSCHTIPTLKLVADDVTYDGYVAGLFKTNCVSCHTASGTPPDLSTYALVKAQADASLKDIKAGTMPQGAPLAAADQAKFAAWVAAGAPQSAGPTYKGQIAKFLQDKCVSCHKAGLTAPDLSTYDLAKANGAASLKDINAGTMPPGGGLSATEKTAFAAWVSASYPVGTDNGSTTANDATASTPAAAAPAAGCTGSGSASATGG